VTVDEIDQGDLHGHRSHGSAAWWLSKYLNDPNIGSNMSAWPLTRLNSFAPSVFR
jgi:hypothetical protein